MRGVFAGYELESGMRWGGKMLAWELGKFLDAELTMGCKSVHPLACPLKSAFEMVNGDFEALIKSSWEKETQDRSKEVKERFGIDDTVAAEGDVKGAKPTAKPDKKTPERNKMLHKESRGKIPLPAGLEPAYHRWSRRDEKGIVFRLQTQNGDPNGRML